MTFTALLFASMLLAAEPEEVDDVSVVAVAPVNVTGPVELTVHYDPPPGMKVNDKAPRRLRVGERKIKIPPGPAPAKAEATPADVAAAHLAVETEYFVCTPEPDAPCYKRAVRFEIPVTSGVDAVRHLGLRTPKN